MKANHMQKGKHGFKKNIKRNWILYLFVLPAVLYIALFEYKAMYGILIAFKDYRVRRGIWGSEWVGFEHFKRLFSGYWFPLSMKNTLVLSFLNLFLSFPLGIVLAILFHEMKSAKFRKFAQTVSYAPHFISVVVVCSMVTMFLNPTSGVINKVIELFGGEAVAFMADSKMFKWIYEISGIWQGVGWSSIIYFAALSGIDSSLLDAAQIDGATRFQRIKYINIPTIMPTIATTFILRCGRVLSVNYEKAYLLQTEANLMGSEILSTYVYKIGLISGELAFSTAANLFQTVINVILLTTVNRVCKRLTDSSLF